MFMPLSHSAHYEWRYKNSLVLHNDECLVIYHLANKLNKSKYHIEKIFKRHFIHPFFVGILLSRAPFERVMSIESGASLYKMRMALGSYCEVHLPILKRQNKN